MPTRLAMVSTIALCAAGATCFSVQTLAASGRAKTSAPQADSPADPGSSGKTLDSEIQRAHALRAQGNYAEAIRSLSQLMLAAPDDARVVAEYGKVLAQQGRSQDAIAFLKRATELQPNDWTLYSALGVAYDQADDAKNAKGAFDRALVLKPGDPVVLNNYAVSRMLAGDLDGAEHLLARARANGAASPKIASNLALLAQLKASKPAAASVHASVPAAQAVAGAAKPASGAPANATPSAARIATTAPISAGQAVSAVPARTGMPAAKSTPAGVNARLFAGTPPAASANSQKTVVMQKVPVDPQAGPVARATKPPRKRTPPSSAGSEAQFAKAAPKKSAIPVLRTADQDD